MNGRGCFEGKISPIVEMTEACHSDQREESCQVVESKISPAVEMTRVCHSDQREESYQAVRNKNYSALLPNQSNLALITKTKLKNQRAFILLPVVFTLTIIVAIAYLLSREGAINAGNVNREHEQDAALYIAQAGYSHAVWQLNQDECTDYVDIPDTALGTHSYLATFTDNTSTSLTAGSPANIKVVGTTANGANYTINRYQIKIYQPPIQKELQPDASSGIDTYLYKWKDTWNYGRSTTLLVSNQWADSLANSLFNFDISAIPSEAKIISAKLELWQNKSTAKGGTVAVRRMAGDWAEGIEMGGVGTASWDERDSGIAWANAGGDYSSKVYASTTIPDATISWFQWDITNLVADWVSSATPNQGFIMTPESVKTHVAFSSSDGTDPALRPKLTISYTCECGDTLCDSAGLPPAKKVYWTDNVDNKIQRSDEDGSNVEDIITGLDGPTGLDIDTVNNKIYWTNGSQIRRANLDGSNNELLYSGVSTVFDIKLDVSGGKMYWTHDSAALVMRADLDGNNSETINTSLDDSTYITLDLSAAYIYLTEFGSGNLSRMDFDGSNVVTLLSDSAGEIGNAIDFVNGKIYWTGGQSFNWIKRADLDGSNAETILIDLNAPQDIAYDADNNRIYWVDALVDPVVKRANADGSNVETIVSGLNRPRGIILVNADDVIFAVSSITLTPVADTYLYEDIGAVNHGTETQLFTGEDNTGPGKKYRSLVKFDISTIPVGATVTSATLRLYQESAVGTGSIDVKAYKITAAWDENIITWSNSGGGNYDGSTDWLASVPLGTNDWVEWSLPVGLIHEWIDGVSGDYGILLGYNSTKNKRADFVSREHAAASLHPQLVIEYTP